MKNLLNAIQAYVLCVTGGFRKTFKMGSKEDTVSYENVVSSLTPFATNIPNIIKNKRLSEFLSQLQSEIHILRRIRMMIS